MFNSVSSDFTFMTIIFGAMIIFSAVMFLWFIFGAIIPFIFGANRNSKLLKEGIPARARVLQIWDTGTSVNENPQIGFLLEVQPEGRSPYQAKAKAIVSRIEIPQFQPGALLDVRLDSQHPERVAIKGVASAFTNLEQMFFQTNFR